jgi:hypothetical protein
MLGNLKTHTHPLVTVLLRNTQPSDVSAVPPQVTLAVAVPGTKFDAEDVDDNMTSPYDPAVPAPLDQVNGDPLASDDCAALFAEWSYSGIGAPVNASDGGDDNPAAAVATSAAVSANAGGTDNANPAVDRPAPANANAGGTDNPADTTGSADDDSDGGTDNVKATLMSGHQPVIGKPFPRYWSPNACGNWNGKDIRTAQD